jgi:uncharacterized protein (DUF362 family)
MQLEIDAEFATEMAQWAAKYEGRPKKELVRLLLLALEREQLVTVAYRDTLMAERLARIDAEPAFRAAAEQALAWAWKDEQMHTVYSRGMLLQIGSGWMRLVAWVQQLAGAIAGWASSVKQHARPSRAPVSWIAASFVVLAGTELGKVPRAMRDKLRLLSFRDFCRAQALAEETAAMCWKRVSELGTLVPELPPNAVAEFARMWKDEEQHKQIFAILHDALDADDHATVPTTELIESLRAVGEYFLPRDQRASPGALGAGGDVWVQEGGPEDDARKSLRRIVRDSGLEQVVLERARELGKPVAELRVVIKPSFMLGYHRSDRSIVTDPALLDELAAFLASLGCRAIVVGEGGNLYDGFFENRGVSQVAAYFGYESEHYRVVDFDADQEPWTYSRGMAQATVAHAWRAADLRILFCKVRSHPIDHTHLNIGGSQGIGARLEEFLFAERFAHRDAILIMPLADFPPHFALLDAYDSAADGLAGIIGCPRAPKPRRLYAGRDALAVDMVATRQMGVTNARDSLLLDAACRWFGDPTGSIRVLGTDAPIQGWRGPYSNELWALLTLFAYPVYQFASGRGAAFLPDMDPVAFPPLHRLGFLLRAYRAVMRTLLGLRA